MKTGKEKVKEKKTEKEEYICWALFGTWTWFVHDLRQAQEVAKLSAGVFI